MSLQVSQFSAYVTNKRGQQLGARVVDTMTGASCDAVVHDIAVQPLAFCLWSIGSRWLQVSQSCVLSSSFDFASPSPYRKAQAIIRLQASM